MHQSNTLKRLTTDCLLCLVVGMGCSQAAWAAPDIGELMHAFAARGAGEATYVESQHLSILKKPLESSGELSFIPPDRLEKRALKPKAESMVIAGDTLTIQRGSRSRSVAISAYPQLAAVIESIRATMAGDLVSLQAAFAIQVADSGEGWQLALTPKDPTLARSIRKMAISGRADLIETVRIERPDGDYSVMTITPVASKQ